MSRCSPDQRQLSAAADLIHAATAETWCRAGRREDGQRTAGGRAAPGVQSAMKRGCENGGRVSSSNAVIFRPVLKRPEVNVIVRSRNLSANANHRNTRAIYHVAYSSRLKESENVSAEGLQGAINLRCAASYFAHCAQEARGNAGTCTKGL